MGLICLLLLLNVAANINSGCTPRELLTVDC